MLNKSNPIMYLFNPLYSIVLQMGLQTKIFQKGPKTKIAYACTLVCSGNDPFYVFFRRCRLIML